MGGGTLTDSFTGTDVGTDTGTDADAGTDTGTDTGTGESRMSGVGGTEVGADGGVDGDGERYVYVDGERYGSADRDGDALAAPAPTTFATIKTMAVRTVAFETASRRNHDAPAYAQPSRRARTRSRINPNRNGLSLMPWGRLATAFLIFLNCTYIEPHFGIDNSLGRPLWINRFESTELDQLKLDQLMLGSNLHTLMFTEPCSRHFLS